MTNEQKTAVGLRLASLLAFALIVMVLTIVAIMASMQ